MYRMEKYFWWNEKQKSLADEAAQFSDAVIAPRIREIERTKRFPWEFMSEIGKKGWFGILIPEAYGGMGEDYGTTGMCIVLEEIARGAAVAVDFYETTIYGYSPIVRFDNVRVPRENLILNEGDGWRVMADALNIERLGVAAGAIGVARSSLAETSNYAGKRVQFGKTLSEIPAIQFMGSDMVTSIILGHTQTYYTACMLDSGRDVPIGASVAKLYTTDTLMKTTLDAVQCHGGDGYTTQYPVERHMRDSKLIQIGAGSNEILRTLIWKQWQKEVRAFEEAERRSTTSAFRILSTERRKSFDAEPAETVIGVRRSGQATEHSRFRPLWRDFPVRENSSRSEGSRPG